MPFVIYTQSLIEIVSYTFVPHAPATFSLLSDLSPISQSQLSLLI